MLTLRHDLSVAWICRYGYQTARADLMIGMQAEDDGTFCADTAPRSLSG